MSSSPETEYLYLDNIYVCSSCQCHISAKQHLISKQFQGKLGVAYLMDEAVNLDQLEPEVVILMTGKHTTCEVRCRGCHAYLGWKYVNAQHSSNQYKVNKYVLEKAAIRMVEYTKED